MGVRTHERSLILFIYATVISVSAKWGSQFCIRVAFGLLATDLGWPRGRWHAVGVHAHCGALFSFSL